MRQVLVFLFVGGVIVVGFGGLWFGYWADRRRVFRMVSQLGEVISVKAVEPPIVRSMITEGGATFWRVLYRTGEGKLREAECFASGLRCKVYRDKPWEQA